MPRATLGELLKSQLIDGKKTVSEADEQRALDASLPLDFVRGTDQPTAVDKGLWLEIYEHVFAAGHNDTTKTEDTTLVELFLADTPVTAEKLRSISENGEPWSDQGSVDATRFSWGSNLSVGDSVAVNFAIENTGDAATTRMEVSSYLSTDVQAVWSDYLSDARTEIVLLFGGSYGGPEEVSPLDPGTYHVMVVSDDNAYDFSLELSVGERTLSFSETETQFVGHDSNVFVASAGDDVLYGGVGNDVLVGGIGQDQFDLCSDYEQNSFEDLYVSDFKDKLTRANPLLQAAFVDYGGNRHGFLAFSEIHPHYYQTPGCLNRRLEKDGCLLIGDHGSLDTQFCTVGDGAAIGNGVSSWLHALTTAHRFGGVTTIVTASEELRRSELLFGDADIFTQASTVIRCLNLANETRYQTGFVFESAVEPLMPCPNTYNVWRHVQPESLSVLWRSLQWLKYHGQTNAVASEGLDFAALCLLWERSMDGDTESRDILEYLRAEIIASAQRARPSRSEAASRFKSTKVALRRTQKPSRGFSQLH